MEKSIFTDDYAVLLQLLRQVRRDAGLTQVQLAERLHQSQSFVSKMEVGQRRLDVIQLRTVCHALGTSLPEFITQLEELLASDKEGTRPRRGVRGRQTRTDESD